MTVNDYLLSEYEDGARGPDKYDCWGLVRDVRVNLFDLPLLPSWGLVDPNNKRQVTDAWHHTEAVFSLSGPTPGALAAVFHGSLLLHVGIVVNADKGISVLDTLPDRGPAITRLADYIEQYDVRFYRDKALSE